MENKTNPTVTGFPEGTCPLKNDPAILLEFLEIFARAPLSVLSQLADKDAIIDNVARAYRATFTRTTDDVTTLDELFGEPQADGLYRLAHVPVSTEDYLKLLEADTKTAGHAAAFLEKTEPHLSSNDGEVTGSTQVKEYLLPGYRRGLMSDFDPAATYDQTCYYRVEGSNVHLTKEEQARYIVLELIPTAAKRLVIASICAPKGVVKNALTDAYREHLSQVNLRCGGYELVKTDSDGKIHRSVCYDVTMIDDDGHEAQMQFEMPTMHLNERVSDLLDILSRDERAAITGDQTEALYLFVGSDLHS